MRLKHNKKRNTAFVYEALVRELTESVVKNNKNKQNKIVSIIKDHFSNGSTLKEELDLYRSIYETRHIEKTTAEKIIYQVKEKHDTLDKKTLFQEQSALINKINRTLSSKIYNNFVPNYKTIASVHSIFQDSLPVKDRVLLEEKIVEQMSASAETPKDVLQPIDSLTYNTFVDSFNKEYKDVLSENQKNLLTTYISSFEDNEVELKAYLNEEIGRIKEELTTAIDQTEDTDLKEKVGKIYSILDETKERQIDTKTVELVLQTQQLLEEMKNDG
jgi:hypothetical protein|tara:strand:+ start:92 stop:910 length:819 start_codon:yes stop_codon:yes gene_type:complete